MSTTDIVWGTIRPDEATICITQPAVTRCKTPKIGFSDLPWERPMSNSRRMQADDDDL